MPLSIEYHKFIVVIGHPLVRQSHFVIEYSVVKKTFHPEEGDIFIFDRHEQNEEIDFGYIYNFDCENLICNNNWIEGIQPFTIISKRDVLQGKFGFHLKRKYKFIYPLNLSDRISLH